MDSFKGTTVIVTGSAQGIGKGIATEFAQRGADLAICDLKADVLAATAEEIKRNTGVRVFWKAIDISKEDQVKAFVSEAEKELGQITVLVNNAGIHPLHPIEEISGEEWDLVMAVNLKAQFYFCKAVLPGMRKRKYGRIINISSEAGKNGGTIAATHYCASKGGVLAFTRNLAQSVGADGITVNAICPGRIVSAMSGTASPEETRRFIDKSVIKRLGNPKDIAFACTYLAHPRASFVTAETMNVNGGTLRE